MDANLDSHEIKKEGSIQKKKEREREGSYFSTP